MTPTPDIATRLPTTQPWISAHENVAEKSGAEQGKDVSAEFRNHLENTNIQPVNAAQNDQVNSIESTQRVNRGEFDAFLKRSGELDKAVSEGKLKVGDPKVMQQRRQEMRMLLHFQSEMQGTAMKVEIASKVVEHGTSGVKTVL